MSTPVRSRHRDIWARNLAGRLDTLGLTSADLHHRLTNDHNIQVTRQAISNWVVGNNSPSPEHQEAISRALDVSAHELFPIEVTP